MQKFSALKRFIVAAVMVGAATAYTAQPAYAGFELWVQDGVGNAIHIWDNDTIGCQSFFDATCGIAGDGDLGLSGVTVGQMTTNSIIGNWTVAGTSDLSSPAIGGPYPHMDMSWQAKNVDDDAVADTLTFFLTDTDFSLFPAAHYGSHGGTVASGGSVLSEAYRGDTNAVFELTNLLFSIPGFNAPTVASSDVFDSGGAPYSITQVVQLTHAVSGTSSGNYELTSQQVPEPASMMLLGSGLIGLAARARRRKQQKA